MANLEKFIQALELVKAEGFYSLGLMINKSGQEIKWGDIIKNKKQIIEVFIDKDATETVEEIQKAMKEKKWIILEIKDELPAIVYAQLRMLSLNNRIQLTKLDKLTEIKQPEESRIILTCLKEVLEKIQGQYPQFKDLFGPIIEV